MRRAGTLLSVLFVLACLGAGCGRTVSVSANRTLEVGLTEYRVLPEDVRAHTGELALLVHNYGRLTHNLAITLGDQNYAATQPIAPGHSVWLTVVLPPGSYTMASNLLSDTALGEYGTLTVTK